MKPFFSRIISVGKEYHPISLISMVGILFSVGNSAVWFVMPILAEKLFKDMFLVGLLIAIPSFIAMFFDIPAGGLSDHVGRKKIIAMGLISMSLLGLALPSVDSLPRFIIFMVLFGFGNLALIVPARAYIMDIAPKLKTSEFFGIFEVSYQIGFSLGPVIAGFLIADELGVGVSNTSIFYFLMSFAALLILLCVRETVVKGKSALVSIRDVIRKDKVYSKSLLDFKTLRYAGFAVLLSTFIMVFIDGIVWTFEPLYTTLGIDTATVGLILSMFVLPFILFEIPAGILADRLGKIRVFILGLFVAGVFLIVFGSARTPLLLGASAFIATTGLALARPALSGFLTDISAEKERGGIVGVWNVAEDFAYVTSPIAGGFIAELYGIGTAFMLVGILLLASIPIVYLAIKKSGFKAGI